MSRQRIAIVRALGGIGDVLCAVPALKRLRTAWPGAEVTYIGLPQVETVVARYPHLVDRFVAFPGFPGMTQAFDPARLCAFLNALADQPRYDLAIQMHGSGSVSNVFTAMLGATRMVGYHVAGLWCPTPHAPAAFPDDLNETDRWLALVERVGARSGDDASAFPIGRDERASLRTLVPGLHTRPYAVIHAGASDPTRRWSPAAFAVVGDELVARGLHVVLTGTAAEADVVAAVGAKMKKPALDLAGRTTLGQAAALVDGACVTVTNDTGTSHIAAALSAPSVVIFIASDPRRWAPADALRHRAVGDGVNDVPIGSMAARRKPAPPPIAAVVDAVSNVIEMAL